MPHDRNGRPLVAGNRVTLQATLESVTPNEGACNATIRIDAPADEYAPQLTLNSKSLERLDEPAAVV